MSFTPRDVKDVSSLVAKKLEAYMNHERREDRFDPQGRYRTTPSMQTLDLMYRMLDTADMKNKEGKSAKSGSPHRDKRSKKSKKSKSGHKDESSSDTRNGCEEDQSAPVKQKKERKEKKQRISPCLVQNSRRVVAVREAERLTQNANKIFEEQDLDKLHVIHRYRPHSPDIAAITENGKVANYTLHVGSALHSKNYVDYYMKEGLQSSKKEYAKRFQRLQTRKEEEPAQDKKCSDEAGQNHKSTSLLRMQEILSPCQSLDSLSSSKPPTPRKLNPLTIEKPIYTTFTNVSHSSRGSSEKHSKASSHLYKAKRYASGFGYRIIADSVNNVETLKENSEAPESRAEIASSEEYCKFSSSQAENHESGREGFGSDVGDKKVLEITDVDMEYKKLQSSIESAPLSKGKESEDKASEDTRAQTNNESYISGSHTSARSTASQFSNQSKEMDRSYRSNHSVASGHSGTYQTRESELYDTTQSEQDIDTGRSISLLSSTPRRYRGKNYKQEPIQTIINPPEVPRLGIPSDVNETTGRVSSLNSSAIEEYLTAEEKALQHPDARALEGRINTSQDRAKERNLDNDDTRAERSQQNFLGSDEAVVNKALETSLPPIDHVVSPKAHKLEKEDDNREKKVSQENEEETARSYKQEKSFSELITEAKEHEDIHNSSVAYQESEIFIDCKEGGSQTKNVCRRKRANEVEGVEAERGEDVMKNMDFHRGEVPAIEKTKTKEKPERGDDTPRTMAAKGRLTKSAKRRGVSNYFTMGEDERGLEKEYFKPVDENEREEYIPSAEQEKGSELNTPASSRPSSACSASSDGTLQSGSGKKKLKQKIPLVDDNCQEQDKVGSNRPQSAASKSVDGRGDDSHSVKNRSNQKSESVEKELNATDKQEELQKEKLTNSVCSQASYGDDSQNYKMHVSSGSRGSITTKERLGTGKGYSIEGEMLARGLDENSDRKSHNLASAKIETERESLQSAKAVEENASKEKASSEDQAVMPEVSKEAVVEKDALEPAREDNQIMGDSSSTEALKIEKEKETTPKSDDVKKQIENEILENSDVKNEVNQIVKENTSSERLEKEKEQAISLEGNGIPPEKQIENKLSTESAHQELPTEEKAFIEGDSVENEIIKEAASASASLLISDGETVIDFRPLSASTAISVSNEHDSYVKGDHKRMSLPKPSKIAEVTETESNMGSGRIAKESNVSHPAERRQSRSRENKMHVVNIADVKLESYENIKEHPAMKRRFSDYLSSKGAQKSDSHSDRNLSLPPLPHDQENAVAAPIAPLSPVKVTEGVKNTETNSSNPPVLKTDPQKESILQDITVDEAQRTVETGNQKEKPVSDHERVEGECSPEQPRLHEKSGSKQDQEILLEQPELQEKTVLDQGTKNEKRIDQIPSQEMNLSEQALTHQEKIINQTPPEKANESEPTLSQHQRSIDKVQSEELKVSQQVQSDQEKMIDQTPSKKTKESQQVPPEQDNIIDQDPSQEVRVAQQVHLDPGKTTDQVPTQEVKVSQQIPSDQDKVMDQTSSEEVKKSEQVPLDQQKEVDQVPSREEEVHQQEPSDQDKINNPVSSAGEKISQAASNRQKAIDQILSQEVKVPSQAPSDQNKINNQIPTQEVKMSQQILPDQEEMNDQIPTQEIKVSQQVPSEQEKIIDHVTSSGEVKVSQQALSDKEKTDQIQAQEVKMSQQVKFDQGTTDLVSSQEVELCQQVPSGKEKIIDHVQTQEETVSEKVPPDQEKRIDQVAVDEAKVSERLPSDQERIIDKFPTQETKDFEQVPSDEGKINNQALTEKVNASQQSLADQENITDKASSEVKESEPAASDQEKVFDESRLEEEMVSNKPAPLVQERKSNHSQPIEVEVSEQVLKKNSTIIDHSSPDEVMISENALSEIDPSSPGKRKVLEQISSDRNKIDQTPSNAVKVLEEVVSENEIKIDQALPLQANVSDCAQDDQETKIGQVLLKDVKVLEPSLSDQEKKTNQTPLEEKAPDQTSSDQENIRNQTPRMEETALKEHRTDEDKMRVVDNALGQLMPDLEKVIVQISLEQNKEVRKSLPEEDNMMEAYSLEQEKGKESLIEQNDAIERPSHKLEKGLESPTESKVVIDQPLQEQEKSIESPSKQKEPIEKPLDQEKGLESPPNQKEMTEQPVHEQEKNLEPFLEQKDMIDQRPHEHEKSNQSPSEQQDMVEQPPHEQDKMSEQIPCEQEKEVESSLDQKNVIDQPPHGQEKVTEQIPYEQEKEVESSLDQKNVIDQPPHKQEKVTEQIPCEQEKEVESSLYQKNVIDQPPHGQEKVTEQIPYEQEKEVESSLDQKNVIDQPPHEQEKVTEQIPYEQEKEVESSLYQKNVIDQPPHEQEKVTEQIPYEQEKEVESSLYQKNVIDQPPHEQEKVTEQIPYEQEKEVESSLYQKNVIDQPPHGQEKGNESPCEQKEVIEQHPPKQDKIIESSLEQEAMIEQPPHERMKSTESPSEQQKMVKQPLHEQEKATEQIPFEEDKGVESLHTGSKECDRPTSS